MCLDVHSAVFIVGIHAREWISPAVTTFALNELTENGEKYEKLLDNLDWYILPLHNPDGYEFTSEHVMCLLTVRSLIWPFSHEWCS